MSCDEGYYLLSGECYPQQEAGLDTIYIVLIVVGSVITLVGIGFGIWACWKNRTGYQVGGENSGVRASYYELV
jgi:hypothetical protein